MVDILDCILGSYKKLKGILDKWLDILILIIG